MRATIPFYACQMSQHTRTITHGKYSYTFHATPCQKMTVAMVYIKIDTTEKELLYTLSQRYKHEKMLGSGTNMTNGIINFVCGPGGVCIQCTENNICKNIVLFIAFLSKTALNTKHIATISTPQSYAKLESSLMKVDIYVTGKCATFIKGNIARPTAEESTKMKTMMIAIEKRAVRARIDIKPPKPIMHEEYKFTCTPDQFIDLCIALKREDAWIQHRSGNDYSLIKRIPCSLGWSTYADALRPLLKTFRTQAGSIGTPAANDVGQEKHKAKCKNILLAVNAVTFIITDLRGHACTFKNIDSLSAVDAESIRIVKDICSNM